MIRTTTRSIRTATAIRDREDFRTSGALYGESTSLGRYDSGLLSGPDLDKFYADCRDIDYVVMSYSTPIAWHVKDDEGNERWHVVSQKFSPTTSKHQSNLYLIPRDEQIVGFAKAVNER